MRTSQAGIKPLEEAILEEPGLEEALEPVEDFTNPDEEQDYSPCTIYPRNDEDYFPDERPTGILP